MVVMPTGKRMCVNIIHAFRRLRFQFRSVKVETAFNPTIREFGVCKLRNVEMFHRRIEHPLNTMRCVAQCFDETIDLPTSIDSSVHFLQQETTVGLMIVVMHEVAIAVTLSNF